MDEVPVEHEAPEAQALSCMHRIVCKNQKKNRCSFRPAPELSLNRYRYSRVTRTAPDRLRHMTKLLGRLSRPVPRQDDLRRRFSGLGPHLPPRTTVTAGDILRSGGDREGCSPRCKTTTDRCTMGRVGDYHNRGPAYWIRTTRRSDECRE